MAELATSTAIDRYVLYDEEPDMVQSQIGRQSHFQTKPAMNTYYYSGSSDEIETILHDGFVDNIKERNTGRARRCLVWLISSDVRSVFGSWAGQLNPPRRSRTNPA